MTPQEFKAWFDGFTEGMGGKPTEAQWKRVKKRVGEIDGNPTSYPVYADRYHSHFPYMTWNTLDVSGGSFQGQSGANVYYSNAAHALTAAGRAEATSLTALSAA